jgi:uncharacterized protein
MKRLLGAMALAVVLAGCGQAAVQPASGTVEGRAGESSEAVASRAVVSSSVAASPAASAAASGAASSLASPAALAGASGAADSSLGAQNDKAVPTASPSTSVAPRATAAAVPAVLPPARRIGPLPFISQTLNNCGPASVAEVLGFFGVQRSQAQVASVLRPDLPAYGMSLYGVPFYGESVGMKAAGGVSGTDELVKAFVANDIPVIVSDQVSRTDSTRHFRPIDGYNDQAGYFIGSDPYLGANHQISYGDFDDIWRISANRWVVLYPPAKQGLVDSILGQYGNRAAVQAGLQRAEQRAGQQPKLPWSWLELADMQIDSGDLKDAGPNIQKGSQLGLPFEAHWLQLKLQRASGAGALT